MLNAAAAAYVAYMEMVSEGASRVGLAPKTRRLPDWLVSPSSASTAWRSLLILGRQMLPEATDGRLLPLCPGQRRGGDRGRRRRRPLRRGRRTHGHTASAPRRAVAPSLDDHMPAVGLGEPINRTLWTLIWAVVAVIFQAMGVAYILGGEISLPQFVRDAIDFVSGPTTFFIGATLGFVAMHRLPPRSWPTAWSPGRSSTCSCSTSA